MFFPESLYLLSARDQQVSWLEPVFFREEVLDTQVGLEIQYQVPQGRCLLLQTAVGDGAAGAAQTCDNLQVLARPPTANVQTYLAVSWYGGALQGRMVNFSGSVIVPELWIVMAQANFSAAANANFVHLSISGLLIPIGNVVRV
jgi:hypothetical protein